MPIWNSIKSLLRIENLRDRDEQARMTRIQRAYDEDQEQGFHYSDIPTAEYRSRFGYLAFSCSSGMSVFVAGWPLVYSRDKVAAVPGDDGKMNGLPNEILEAG